MYRKYLTATDHLEHISKAKTALDANFQRINILKFTSVLVLKRFFEPGDTKHFAGEYKIPLNYFVAHIRSKD